MKAKHIFYFLWFLLILLPVVTVYSDFTATSSIKVILSDKNLTLKFFERLTGLIALTLLPVQVFLGGFMSKLTDRFGGWIFSFHITEALIIYGLVITHPILNLIRNIPTRGIDPFSVFTDMCLACRTHFELYLTFGKIAFWLVTLTYFIAKYRTLPLLQRNWHTIHLLNYVVFFLISLHAYFAGSDILSPNYFWYFILIQIFVGILTIRKVWKIIKKNFLTSSNQIEAFKKTQSQ